MGRAELRVIPEGLRLGGVPNASILAAAGAWP
jgi:hypothetical protein